MEYEERDIIIYFGLYIYSNGILRELFEKKKIPKLFLQLRKHFKASKRVFLRLKHLKRVSSYSLKRVFQHFNE